MVSKRSRFHAVREGLRVRDQLARDVRAACAPAVVDVDVLVAVLLEVELLELVGNLLDVGGVDVVAPCHNEEQCAAAQ